MLTGKIFRARTGRDFRECNSTFDIWEAVKSSKSPEIFNAVRYTSNVVSNRGGVFDHAFYDDDVSCVICEL